MTATMIEMTDEVGSNETGVSYILFNLAILSFRNRILFDLAVGHPNNRCLLTRKGRSYVIQNCEGWPDLYGPEE